MTLKNYSSKTLGEVIHLGNTNPTKAILSSLGDLNYSPKEAVHIYYHVTGGKNKNIKNKKQGNHIIHLRFAYELSGGKLVDSSGKDIQKADFLKKNWREKSFVGKIANATKALIDSELVLEWMKQRHVRYAFHGHQHIPALNVRDRIYLIGAGSSTGVMKDFFDSYMSYNIAQYDLNKRKIVSCTLFYEDVNGILPKHMHTMKFKGE